MSGSDLFGLAGQVAVVTGGSRGIGRAIAAGFAEAGADVVIASPRSSIRVWPGRAPGAMPRSGSGTCACRTPT